MKAPSITLLQITELLDASEIHVQTIFGKVTLVAVRLPSGFVLTASSGAVSKENYDEEVGKGICMNQIEDQLWKLEGYALQKQLADVPDLEKERFRLLAALRGLTGFSTRKDGEAMLAGLKMVPVPSDEMPAMVAAIEVLMEMAD